MTTPQELRLQAQVVVQATETRAGNHATCDRRCRQRRPTSWLIRKSRAQGRMGSFTVVVAHPLAKTRRRCRVPLLFGKLVPSRISTPVRSGTTSRNCRQTLASGKVIGQCHCRHRHQELLKFLNRLDADLPPSGAVHVIMDKYGTHKAPRVARWLPGIRAITSISQGYPCVRDAPTRCNRCCWSW